MLSSGVAAFQFYVHHTVVLARFSGELDTSGNEKMKHKRNHRKEVHRFWCHFAESVTFNEKNNKGVSFLLC